MKPSETDMQQDLVQEAMRYQIEASAYGAAPAIGAPAVGAPAVVAPTIGYKYFVTEIEAVVVRYQFSTPDKTVKCKREGGNEKEDGKRKKAEPKTKKGLIPKIPKKGLANKVPRKRQVVNALMVDNDVEVGREVNFNAISSEYGGDLLELKKGEEKDNNDKKDVEEKVKFEEEKVQETMVVAEVAKTDIVFFNQEEVDGEAYQSVDLQASTDQTTAIYVEKQTLEVEKTKDEASQLDLMKSEVDITSKKRHELTEEENNESAFKMACRMNELHAHLESFFRECYWNLLFKDPSPRMRKARWTKSGH
ncbi:hypothetical protein GIB67_002901 [Kingdonia uniflora]|uniref:Uncharacterized protein n=1 Tax=Kingdonia uniflora TaxID=39325 RepID=A0A7J7NF84_9MAGN|nr:hypothetical protein GIB67_002901 [Kingdonia uniflora]